MNMEARINELKPLYDNVNWQDKHVYATWLSQAYYIAKRSTSYLGLCLFHSEKYPEFQARCTQHIAEETGHEKLILNDLKNLGYNSPLPELPETSAIYQTQYYSIVAVNPLSFLGYVFFLELLAPIFGPTVMNKVTEKKAISFLKVHTKADENHIEEANKILASIKDETLLKQINHNFETTLTAYTSMINKVGEKTGLALKAS